MQGWGVGGHTSSQESSQESSAQCDLPVICRGMYSLFNEQSFIKNTHSFNLIIEKWLCRRSASTPHIAAPLEDVYSSYLNVDHLCCNNHNNTSEGFAEPPVGHDIQIFIH